MQTKLRNWIIGGAAFCMATSLFAGAKPGGYDDHERRLRALEHHARRTTEQNEGGRWGGVNPSARGCPLEWSFFMTLDFLYWRAQNTGFAYAYDQFEGFGAGLGGSSLGNYIRISHDWDPGFRVGVGFNTPYNGWDIFLNYTYYHNKSTDSVSRPPRFPGNTGDGLHPLWPGSAVVNADAFENAFGLWRFNLNLIDLEIGRAYYISKALSFRPQWGVRAGWLYQDFFASFRDPANVNTERNNNFIGEDNYWGLGPRAGARADWHLGYGFGIFGNATASLLYGKTMTYFLFEYENPINSLTFQAFNRMKDDFSQLVPNLQMQLGLDWGMCFDDWFFFALNASWEVNYWWGRLNLPVLIGGLSQGATTVVPALSTKPVTMEGVTFSAKLDF